MGGKERLDEKEKIACVKKKRGSWRGKVFNRNRKNCIVGYRPGLGLPDSVPRSGCGYGNALTLSPPSTWDLRIIMIQIISLPLERQTSRVGLV